MLLFSLNPIICYLLEEKYFFREVKLVQGCLLFLPFGEAPSGLVYKKNKKKIVIFSLFGKSAVFVRIKLLFCLCVLSCCAWLVRNCYQKSEDWGGGGGLSQFPVGSVSTMLVIRVLCAVELLGN